MNQLKSLFPKKIFIDPAQFYKFNIMTDRTKSLIHFKTTGSDVIFRQLIQHHLPITEFIMNEKKYTKERC